ncbi:MAG: hypothetical protein KDD22_00780 [Bdellovibrionales bacterium]|nr:hypothetical protein [Bdellovibrionales bacterium]
MLRVLASLLISLTLISCSKGSSGGGEAPYTPLDQAGQEDLQTITSSVGALTTSVDERLPEKNGTSQWATARKMIAQLNSKPNSKQAEALREVFDNDDCEIKLPDEMSYLNTGKAGMTFPVIEVSVGGGKCPISLTMKFSGQQADESRFAGVLQMDFEVKSPEYQEQMDLQSFHFTGNISAFAQPLGNNGVKTGGKMALSGNGVSKKVGPFKYSNISDMDLQMSFPQGAGNLPQEFASQPGPGGDFNLGDMKGKTVMQTGFEFKDKRALLEAHLTINSFTDIKEQYFLNKQLITREEYEKLIEDMKIPGMDDESPGQNPNPNPDPVEQANVRCNLKVYKESDLSYQDLQQSLASGTPVSVPPAFQFDSCGGKTQYADIQGEILIFESLYSQNFLQMNFGRLNSEEARVSWYAQPLESFHRADTHDGLTLELQCLAEISCGH